MKNKSIIITEKILNNIYPYQGTTKKLNIGDELRILNTKIPCVCSKGSFCIVTNDQFDDNTNSMIERSSDKDAKKWGWDKSTKEFYDKCTNDSETFHLNRWSIQTKYLK